MYELVGVLKTIIMSSSFSKKTTVIQREFPKCMSCIVRGRRFALAYTTPIFAFSTCFVLSMQNSSSGHRQSKKRYLWFFDLSATRPKIITTSFWRRLHHVAVQTNMSQRAPTEPCCAHSPISIKTVMAYLRSDLNHPDFQRFRRF